MNSGDIWVLGGKPGTAGSGIPGPRVGYMPQEISLIGEFSVIGALYYFGRINGMDSTAIEERHSFLSKLLQLPPRDRLVKSCSGGQQRRISFAAAMVHNPELLILDEPTVGLDPILREKQVYFFLFEKLCLVLSFCQNLMNQHFLTTSQFKEIKNVKLYLPKI